MLSEYAGGLGITKSGGHFQLDLANWLRFNSFFTLTLTAAKSRLFGVFMVVKIFSV